MLFFIVGFIMVLQEIYSYSDVFLEVCSFFLEIGVTMMGLILYMMTKEETKNPFFRLIVIILVGILVILSWIGWLEVIWEWNLIGNL